MPTSLRKVAIGVALVLWFSLNAPLQSLTVFQPLSSLQAVALAEESRLSPQTANLALVAQSADTEPLEFVGTLQVADQHPLVMRVSGVVEEILVEAGDVVEAGDPLLRLDNTFLEWDVQRAEIQMELARVDLLEQGEVTSESELAIAQANLALARATLATFQIGPAEDELAGAQASASSAWARYNEVRAGPSQARLDQLKVNVEKMQIVVTEAQRNYDEVSWRPDVGRTPQAAALQRATIDLQAAQGAFDEATSPAPQSEVQSALAAAHNAQHRLNQLREWPQEAEIALAEARVSAAEAALQRVQELSGSGDLRSAELRVDQALIGLAEARLRLDSATLRSPVAGTVLSLDVEEGEQLNSGTTAAQVGDPRDLKLVVPVPFDMVHRIRAGDPASIVLFGSTETALETQVTKVSPVASPGTSSFPVTFHLPEVDQQRFSPGMLVSVTVVEE